MRFSGNRRRRIPKASLLVALPTPSFHTCKKETSQAWEKHALRVRNEDENENDFS